MTHTPDVTLMPKIQNIPFWNSRLDDLVKDVGSHFIKRYPAQSHTVFWNERYSLAALIPYALAELDSHAKSLKYGDWKLYVDVYTSIRQDKQKGDVGDEKKTTVVLSDESIESIQRIGARIDSIGEWKGTHLRRDVKDKQGVKIGEVYNAPLVIIVALQYALDSLKK